MTARLDVFGQWLWGPVCRWIARRWDPVRAALLIFGVAMGAACAVDMATPSWWLLAWLFLIPINTAIYALEAARVRAVPPDMRSVPGWSIRGLRSWMTVLLIAVLALPGAIAPSIALYRAGLALAGYLMHEPPGPRPQRLRDRITALVDRWLPAPAGPIGAAA